MLAADASRARKPTGTVLELPSGVWQVIVRAITRSHASSIAGQHPPGQETTRGDAQRAITVTLARLAWTCRGAYIHLRPHIWSTLRLVFRSEAPKYRDAGPVLLARHNQVMGASFIPDYSTKRSRRARDLARHVAKVSKYPMLAPFVVHNGKLFLASFAQGRRPPDFSGIESLWGRKVDARRVGQLDLVHYPMHLVTTVVMDILDLGVRLHPDTILDDLPFLFSPDRDQVSAFTLLATNPGATVFALHQAMCQHHDRLVDFDYGFKGGSRARPLVFPERARVLTMHTDGAFNGGDVVRNLRAMEHVELRGAGGFSVQGWCKPPVFVDRVFKIASLTTLVLDYDAPTEMNLPGHFPSAYSFPSLVSLAITFPLADALFSHVQPPPKQSWFPLHAFPRLLHLTLLNTRPVSGFAPMPDDPDPSSQMHWVPRLPYEHMPVLASFTVPATHRRFPNTARIHVHHLHYLLTTCAQLTHLSLPGLRSVNLLDAAAVPALEARSPIQSLTSLSVRASHAPVLARWCVFPSLATLRVIADASVRNVRTLLASAPRVPTVVVYLPAGGGGAGRGDVWKVLGECAVQVRRVVVRGGRGGVAEQVAEEPLVGPEDEVVLDGDREQDEETAGEIERAGDAAATGYSLPFVESLENLHRRAPPPTLALPALRDLTVHVTHLAVFIHVLPHVARLTIHGRPQQPVHALQLVLNAVSPACRVALVDRGPSTQGSGTIGAPARGAHLTLRYAGKAHASVWRAVAPWGPLEDGAVGKVCVELGSVVDEGQARVVAGVLGQLLSTQTQGVALSVVGRAKGPKLGKGTAHVERLRTVILAEGGGVKWVK